MRKQTCLGWFALMAFACSCSGGDEKTLSTFCEKLVYCGEIRSEDFCSLFSTAYMPSQACIDQAVETKGCDLFQDWGEESLDEPTQSSRFFDLCFPDCDIAGWDTIDCKNYAECSCGKLTCEEIMERYCTGNCCGDEGWCCPPNSELRCGPFDDTPGCYCIDGYYVDGDRCADLGPHIESCCYCLSQYQDAFHDDCLETSVGQCILAIESGNRVNTGLNCAQDHCPADCGVLSCNGSSCGPP